MQRVFQLGYNLNLAGTETVFMNWYRYADRSKVQFDFGVLHEFNTPHAEEIRRLGGRILIVPRGNGVINRLKFLVRLYNTLRQNGPYAAFQSHDHWLGGLSCMAAWAAGVPRRVTISHFDDGAKKVPLLAYPKRTLARLFIRLFSTSRLAVSQEAGLTLYGKHLSFATIHNGIDLGKFAYNPALRAEMRRKLGVEDKVVIGHIGRFTEQKNHPFLVRIFDAIYKQNPQAVLILIGVGPDEENIRAQVRHLGLQDAVRFEGLATNVPAYYQAFDAFLFPSLFEGVGIVALEAQTSGLPCFISDVTPREAFVCNATALSLNESPKVWADAVLGTLAHYRRKDETDAMRRAGFDARDTAKQIEKEYLCAS